LEGSSGSPGGAGDERRRRGPRAARERRGAAARGGGTHRHLCVGRWGRASDLWGERGRVFASVCGGVL